MPPGCGLAERAVQFLVSSSADDGSKKAHFTVDPQPRNGLQILRQSPGKMMGALPHVIPSVGEFIHIRRSTSNGVYYIQSNQTGTAALCREPHGTIRGLLQAHKLSNKNMIHFTPCRRSYSVIAHVSPPSVQNFRYSKNFKYLIALLQKKMIEWCFDYFARNRRTNEIPEALLCKHFPALLAFTSDEREVCVEEAISYSFGMLILFHKTIVLRSRTRNNLAFPLLTSREEEMVSIFEQSLHNCWLACQHPVTEILRCFSELSREISLGYTLQSTTIQQCIAIVFPIVRFAIRRTRMSIIDEIFYTNLYLLLQCGEMRRISESFHRNGRAPLRIMDADMLTAFALQPRSQYVTENAEDRTEKNIERSLDVYSLFSQTPEDHSVEDSGIPLLCVDRITLDSSTTYFHPEDLCDASFKFNIPAQFFKNLSYDEMEDSFSTESEDFFHLTLRVPLQEESRCTEEDALEAVRASARKRRRAASALEGEVAFL